MTRLDLLLKAASEDTSATPAVQYANRAVSKDSEARQHFPSLITDGQSVSAAPRKMSTADLNSNQRKEGVTASSATEATAAGSGSSGRKRLRSADPAGEECAEKVYCQDIENVIDYLFAACDNDLFELPALPSTSLPSETRHEIHSAASVPSQVSVISASSRPSTGPQKKRRCVSWRIPLVEQSLDDLPNQRLTSKAKTTHCAKRRGRTTQIIADLC